MLAQQVDAIANCDFAAFESCTLQRSQDSSNGKLLSNTVDD
jgi:hypothetical protein